MTSMIRTENLAKTYRSNGSEVLALRGVDLTVDAGELVAVMGPSGCGKSTLLHLLGGLDRPSSGRMFLDGERVDELSETAWAKLRRKKVGYVFQAFNLLGDLSAADNVELPALVAGVGPTRARARRQELLETLGIADRAAALPGQLSGGEQQRVAIARALVNEPEVVLADEPTGNLNSAATRDVLDVLRAANASGQTIVVVTHDPRVAAVADRVLSMRDGLIVDQTCLEGTDRSRAVIGQLIQLEV